MASSWPHGKAYDFDREGGTHGFGLRPKAKENERLKRRTAESGGFQSTLPEVDRLERGKEFGYRVERGLERMVRDEQKAHPWQKPRSGYMGIVGENPDVDPGDHRTPLMKVRAIKEAIDRGGWTRAENRRLHKMLKKWTLRLEGKDVRFRIGGNTKGRKWGEFTDREREEIAIHKAVERILKLGERKAERSES